MVVVVYCVAVLVAVAWACRLYLSKSKPLPPGPPGLPLIGHLHKIKTRYPWVPIHEWHKTYGPILTVRAGQQIIISLGDYKTTKDLLIKRTSTYGSRPPNLPLKDSLIQDVGVFATPHGHSWMYRRKIQSSVLTPGNSKLYKPLQDLESRQLIFNLLSNKDFGYEFGRYTASVLSGILYGRRIKSDKDESVKEINAQSNEFLDIQTPGIWLADMFPIFKWLPNGEAKWRKAGDACYSAQLRFFKKCTDLALSSETWSWTKEKHRSKKHAWTNELICTLGEMFEGGSHTSTAMLSILVLACVSYPDAVRRVHQEIDAQVGEDRLPDFKDIPELKYTLAFVKEAQRHWPVFPAGTGHYALADDEYQGYRIPKGAIVVPNQWTLDQDNELFEDAEKFEPQRWLDNRNLPQGVFGWGRRRCPAQEVARSSLELNLARLVWAYDMAWAEEQGPMPVGIELEKMVNGFCQSADFKVKFSVRSDKHERIVREGVLEDNSDAILNDIGTKIVE
ncbi:hypothetical protein CDD82_1831 [Ophiocordyceps australis]|uniref:Cytochrome P450 n=1 Tax=Ophiocordyceps australis TaxID=1399860 RepID=A0A2C5Y4Z5_9HYPO|nr:hypothetical protein CDD82_1831 [Ophiocordyceps australis]